MRVKIADYGVLKENGLLMTIGLGSCVGIALYDQRAKVAGLAHILLSESSLFPKKSNLAKFADTAVPLLLYEMGKVGAAKSRITAKIAGGSELFQCNGVLKSVGARNIIATKKALNLEGIPLLSADVGGKVGRTMHFYADDGKVLITRVGQRQKEI